MSWAFWELGNTLGWGVCLLVFYGAADDTEEAAEREGGQLPLALRSLLGVAMGSGVVCVPAQPPQPASLPIDSDGLRSEAGRALADPPVTCMRARPPCHHPSAVPPSLLTPPREIWPFMMP
eukprot:COSAG01_NODE_2527_length_7500_cov_4.494393_5_plen_121_part_00